MKPVQLLLSCEHAVNDIPADFARYFAGHEDALNSHRGIDFGALAIAQQLRQHFHCELYSATVSRLLIECNRSLRHQACFSEFSLAMSTDEKNRLLETFYRPYRAAVQQRIQDYINDGFQVWHLSIHSFTPVWNGTVRTTDIGLLYDPRRPVEKTLARRWQALLNPHTRTRRNYPYLGVSDGFTTALRKVFSKDDYMGMEVEVNQALAVDEAKQQSISILLFNSLKQLLPVSVV
ncbi:N-formylglutamate amidohydrolase [Legionella sp. CNM-4043-24]|uniref:N-formylglutamate amidohydrolase n=1 Tax=Legionella sp. CNM-4043-24 TaxID=3421646 RepID=UPI00403AC40B